MIDGDRLVISSSIYYWTLPDGSELRNLMSEQVTVNYENDIDEHHLHLHEGSESSKYTVVDISDNHPLC